MLFSEAHFPSPPIDAYGGGGFRINSMRMKGSLIVLPERAVDWKVAALDEANGDNLAPLLGLGDTVELALIGTGAQMRQPPAFLRALFEDVGMRVDFLATGAACRTYNVLLSENRRVAAALIAVD